jgi:hypothetical protein
MMQPQVAEGGGTTFSDPCDALCRGELYVRPYVPPNLINSIGVYVDPLEDSTL